MAATAKTSVPVAPKRSPVAAIFGSTEALMAAAAIGIVLMLLMPLPTPLLDLLLVFNLALSLSVLLVTAYLHDPLEFSVFPSLLLFMALFRLALSISLMRAILSTARGGEVVDAFGHMVLAGNYVIGFVLYLTLVIVQFLVVTGGTSRIAEVVARFTLDAMPGKQMAIDADLNAGLITDVEARTRRRKIAAEADFYGAMDGASKFVRGDGMAAMAVTAVNLVGGLIIGMAQLGMDAKTALGTYALLTVGQGLVIQIPGLLMSTASGLIVTRAASEGNLSDDVLSQFKGQPEAFMAAAIGCLLLGLMPGLPKLPLWLLGGGLLAVARRVAAAAVDPKAPEAPPAAPDKPVDMRDHLPLDALVLELGYGLVPLAMKGDGGQLLERITNLRKQLAEDLGLIVPPIRVRDNLTLEPNTYLLRLRGVLVAQGTILPRFFLAMNGGAVTSALEGDHVSDPTFGLPAVWVTPDQRAHAERRGYIVVDSTSVCITHVGETLRQRAAELLTRQELADILEVAKRDHPAIVGDLVPDVVSKSTLQSVLQTLLDERVGVRDLVSILEALAETVGRVQTLDAQVEHVRRRLARNVIDPLLVKGDLACLVIDPGLERRLTDGIVETPYGGQVQVPAALMQAFISSLSSHLDAVAGDGHHPVLVTSGRLRLPLRRIMKKFLARLVLVSYDEVAETSARLRTLGMVKVDEP
jgi:flagellar biosynthesis protein FlhA